MTRSTKTFIIVAALFDALRMKMINFIGKDLTYQNQTSQFKITINLGVIKKNICWTQNLNTYIYSHKKILTKTAIFMVKNISGSNANLFNYSLYFWNVACDILKIKYGSYLHDIPLHNLSLVIAKSQKSIGINFCDLFVEVSGKYKKYLQNISCTYICTQANV